MLQGQQLLFRSFIKNKGTALMNMISSQTLQNEMKISPPVLLVSLEDHFQVLGKMYFIRNFKCIRDNRTYNEGGIGRCKLD